MPIVKYNPFAETEEFPSGLRLLQDTVNRLFADGGGAARPWAPAVDIYETENDLVFKADIPGVDKNAIEVRMENGTLALKGERKFTDESKNGYYRVERGYGAFSRFFTLPETVDPEKVAADYKDGVLTVTLPKKDIAKPRTIQVKVTNN